MKKILLVVLAMIFLSGFISIAFAEVTQKEDKFTGEVIIQTKPNGRLLYSSPTLWVLTGFKGKTNLGFAAAFVFSHDSWKYLECHSVYLLIDGNRFRPIKTKHKGSIGRGFVIEYIQLDLTFEELELLSKAERLEIKVCNEIFVPDKDGTLMTDLRNFVQKVKSYEEELKQK